MLKRSKKVEAISTFLGPGVSIEGSIEFTETIRLDGRFRGRIDGAGGMLIVGQGAVIEADIQVGIAMVQGEVDGTLHAEERIEIHPPGKMTGEIQAPVIVIARGATFNGRRAMQELRSETPGAAVLPLKKAAVDGSRNGV